MNSSRTEWLQVVAFLLAPEDSGTEYRFSSNLSTDWGRIKAVLWFFISLMLCFGISRLC